MRELGAAGRSRDLVGVFLVRRKPEANMTPVIHDYLTIGIPTAVVTFGILMSNSRFNRSDAKMDSHPYGARRQDPSRAGVVMARPRLQLWWGIY